MDFERFRNLNGWTLEQAAENLRVPGDAALQDITGSTVAKHERGVQFPRPAVVARYAEITDGAVTWSDWDRVRREAEERGAAAPPRTRGRKKANPSPADHAPPNRKEPCHG